MKKYCALFIVICITLIFFTGCSSSEESVVVDNMQDLNVPEGFDFETTHLLHLMANSSESGTLVVTQQNGAEVFKGYLDTDSGGLDHHILLPTSISSLDFRFRGEVLHRNIAPSTECLYLTFTNPQRDRGERIDSDGDGVEDEFDDFPNDPELAYLIEYPPQDSTRCRSYGTLAFEDRWPGEGDYDFNDVILNYYIYECTNRWSETRHIYLNLYYSVDGAGFNNGFYIKLPYNDGGVAYYDYPYAEEQFDAYYDEGENANIILRIFEEGHAFMPDPPTFHNTEAGDPFTAPIYFQQIHVILEDSDFPEEPTIADYPPYNPYLVIDQTAGREVHFADYLPSNVVNMSWFGTQDDTSDPETGRYYVTDNDLPWGLHLPCMFDHPLEKISIINAYPNFADWVNSGGNTHTDWYNNPVPGNVYNFVDQVDDLFD
jgi:LruC domain-containing protein